MEEIIKRCKASVTLEVNGYRDVYQSIEDWVAEQRSFGDNISKKLEDRLVKAGCVYRLQFYPDTPIGFYVVIGTSLNEVVTEALRILTDKA